MRGWTLETNNSRGRTIKGNDHDDLVEVKQEGSNLDSKLDTAGTPMDIDVPANSAPTKSCNDNQTPRSELMDASRILEFGGASLVRCSLERLRGSHEIKNITHAISSAR